MQRLQQLKEWLANDVGFSDYSIEPASSDASFRRYFRVTLTDGSTFVVMDAPPAQEDTAPFIKISTMFADVGLNVPLIKQADVKQGFLLLTDLGAIQYLEKLTEENVESLYADALDALLTLHSHTPKQSFDLPPYDNALLMREMELFREWYLQKHLGMTLQQSDHDMLDSTFTILSNNALEQPTVCVHRDYHSRNLMVTDVNNPGVLDFQDAVIGPVTYDLVSLLRDCYINWPRQRVEDWALAYLHRVLEAGVINNADDQTLLRWFDWMGVQRHLKAVGIFSRLNHRDGKPGYLNDIPRTLSYIKDVTSRYDELFTFNELFSSQKLKKIL